MQKSLFVSGMLAGTLALAPAAGAAQMALPIQLGVSGGAAFPMGDLGRDDAVSTGWGFEVNGTFQVAPGIGIYAAFDRYEFPFDEDPLLNLGQAEGDIVDQGFAGGIRLAIPAGGFGLSPWVRGGAVYNSAQFDYDTVDDDPETDSALGFEVGGGLDFPLGFVVSVTPSVRYRSYKPDIAGSNEFDMSYVVGELGLTFRF
jgi:hypothetical protein